MICAYHAMPCLTKLPSSVAIQQSLTWQPGSRQLAQELSASRTTVTWVLFSCFPTSLGRWQPELLSPFGWDGPKNIGKSMGDFNYLSLPPSLPPTGELGFLVTSGRMQLQIYTCVLIVWEASSHGVCVLERKRRPLGRTLNQNYPWEKRTNNMMNCIFMILSHMIYIYICTYKIYIYDIIICILMGVDQNIILRINGWNLRKEIYLGVNDGCQGIQLTNFPRDSMELLGLRQVLPTNKRWNQWIDHMGVFSKM